MRRTVLVLLLVLGACGPNARQIKINTMLAGLNGASDAFAVFDHDHKREIIAKCDVKVTPEVECLARLKAYEDKQARVIAALTAGYLALSVAVTLNDKHTLAAAISAVLGAQQAWTALKEVGP